jgi:hypothetical protein
MGIIKHQHFKPLDTHDHSSTTEFSYLKKKMGAQQKFVRTKKEEVKMTPDQPK